MSLKQDSLRKMLTLTLIVIALSLLSGRIVIAQNTKEEIFKLLNDAIDACEGCSLETQRDKFEIANGLWRGLSVENKLEFINELLKGYFEDFPDGGTPKFEVVRDTTGDIGRGGRVIRDPNDPEKIKIILSGLLEDTIQISDLIPFLLYEAEIARIRAEIEQEYMKEKDHNTVKAMIEESLKKAAQKTEENIDIYDYVNKHPDKGDIQREAYENFMEEAEKQNINTHYASWMFEKIVGQGGAKKGDKNPCDLPLQGEYQLDDKVAKILAHDIDARQKARKNYGCPKVKLFVKVKLKGDGECILFPDKCNSTIDIQVFSGGKESEVFPIEINKKYNKGYFIDNAPFIESEGGNFSYQVELMDIEKFRNCCESLKCKDDTNCKFYSEHQHYVLIESNGGKYIASGSKYKESCSCIELTKDKSIKGHLHSIDPPKIKDTEGKIYNYFVDFILSCSCARSKPCPSTTSPPSPTPKPPVGTTPPPGDPPTPPPTTPSVPASSTTTPEPHRIVFPNDVNIKYTFSLKTEAGDEVSTALSKSLKIPTDEFEFGKSYVLVERAKIKVSIKFSHPNEEGYIDVELTASGGKNEHHKLTVNIVELEWTYNGNFCGTSLLEKLVICSNDYGFDDRKTVTTRLPIIESPLTPPSPTLPPGDTGSATPTRDSRRSFTVGIGLNSGYQFWSLDDFDKSREYWEMVDVTPDVDASTTDIDRSFFGGINAFVGYSLPNAHMVGLTIGYEHFFGGSFESTVTSEEITTVNTRLDLSAHTFPVGLFYKIPVRRNLFMKIAGCLDFYSSTIDYDYTMTFDEEGVFAEHGEFKDKDLGCHFSLGAEYRVHKNVALTFDAGYGFGALDDFRGTLVDQDGGQNDMLLIMEESLTHALISEPLVSGIRHAEIDFSGPRFSIGLRFSSATIP